MATVWGESINRTGAGGSQKESRALPHGSSLCLSRSPRAHFPAFACQLPGPQSKRMQISGLCPKLALMGIVPGEPWAEREGAGVLSFPRYKLSTCYVQAGLQSGQKSGSAALGSLTVTVTPRRILVTASPRRLVWGDPWTERLYPAPADLHFPCP